VSDPIGGTRQPPSETVAAEESAVPSIANRLLQSSRSFAATLIMLIVVIGVPALLTTIGISRLVPIEHKPSLQEEASPPPKQPGRSSEEPVEPPKPFKSLVVDAARSYFASTNANAQTEMVIEKLRFCLGIEDGSKERLDCYDGMVPPDPKPKPPVAKLVADCKFLKEEDERLGCFNRFLVQPAPPKAAPKAQPSK
jgi:hypothetical protein